MSVRYAAKSDVGRVRQVNEDSYLVQEPLFAVADGMGGHAAGDVASRLAVDVLTQDIDTGNGADREILVNAVKHANSTIFEEAQSDSSLSGMGTTCTLLFITDGEGRIAHVGDSRAYLLRNGKLSQLTDDHTLVNRMVQEGRLRPEEADRHPQRSIITRALGVDAKVKVDYKTFDLESGDRIILCSDGLTSMIDASTIQRVLSEITDGDEASERLISLANEAGGEDNITVVLVDVVDPGPRGAGVASGAAVREPARAEPPVRTEPAGPESTRPAQTTAQPRRWLRRLILWVVALAILGIGGFFLVDYLVSRSFYVGANDDGFVVVYQGIPEEVLGLDLKDEQNVTTISVDDLPEFLREDVEDGIKVETIEEARAKVDTLRARAEATQNRESDAGTNDQGSQGDNN